MCRRLHMLDIAFTGFIVFIALLAFDRLLLFIERIYYAKHDKLLAMSKAEDVKVEKG